MRRSARARVAAALLVGVLGAAVVAIAVAGSSDRGRPSAQSERSCPLRGVEARRCWVQRVFAEVNGLSPTAAVARADRLAEADRGYLAGNCHLVMHEVARRYAAAHHATLARLQRLLPRSDEPGCAGGFSHGMVTAVAPEIDPSDPGGTVASACTGLPTRFQRYSCVHGFGHAFMRIWQGHVPDALRWCESIGAQAPDCAQGVFHDHWLASAGQDGATTTDPSATARAFCAQQPRRFVRVCWYRAFIDTRPAGYRTATAAQVLAPCAGLAGLQRASCITGTSVIGSPNPLAQFRVCAALPATDQLACVRGVKAENLTADDDDDRLRLIRRCRWLGPVADGCYEWLGRTMTVATDGAFARRGCPRLADRLARSACQRGARRVEQPLETFS